MPGIAFEPALDLPGAGPIFTIYFTAFLLAAIGCFASLHRLDRIDDADTQLSLTALIATSGGWAAAQAGFLAAPTTDLKLASYVIGLVLGLAAVWAWLYFCSAYTGRSYHHNPAYRRFSVVVFVAVVAVKLTNPVHQGYFSTVEVARPFPHLAVQTGPLHWTAMGLAYALTFVGFFMLFELFAAVDYDTRPLLALVALTGLPVVFDVVGYSTPYLIDMTYEPLGVAAFAIGVGFVHLERFEAVRLAGERTTPIIALDGDGRIRDTNLAARDLFPELMGARTLPLESVLPTVTARVGSDDAILEVQHDDQTRYVRATESPMGTAKAGLGRTIVFTDVTEREEYRRELERQNERLERFAGIVSHDLRNPLTVAQGHLEFLRETDEPADEDVAAIATALNRMEDLIADVLALARQGQPIDDEERLALSVLVRDSWEMVDAPEATVTVADDLQFRADPDRLKQLCENLFRNALDHVGADVTITVGSLATGTGFYVEDDGPGIPADERDAVFDQGYTTVPDGTGFGLAIVAEVVDAHGWTIAVTESEAGGARFEITGVETVDPREGTERTPPSEDLAR